MVEEWEAVVLIEGVRHTVEGCQTLGDLLAGIFRIQPFQLYGKPTNFSNSACEIQYNRECNRQLRIENPTTQEKYIFRAHKEVKHDQPLGQLFSDLSHLVVSYEPLEESSIQKPVVQPVDARMECQIIHWPSLSSLKMKNVGAKSVQEILLLAQVFFEKKRGLKFNAPLTLYFEDMTPLDPSRLVYEELADKKVEEEFPSEGSLKLILREADLAE